ncbi:MAG: phosphopentomutase [Candidatus Eisenbacteria bacterium]
MTSRPRKVLLIILDGVGVGALPDADLYGDDGSNTLGNIAEAVGGLNLPNLEKLGLGNITPIKGVTPQTRPAASYARLAEASPGKDSTSGHWEIAGLILDTPFPLYPDGFPPEVIEPFEEATGRQVIGNVAASGTEIIKELGDEHVRTGKLIVYTSADSVFQIAAHMDVVPLEDLYAFSLAARRLLKGKHSVGRVIARPFTGPSGDYTRTADRKDFSLPPPRRTLLDELVDARLESISIGKVDYLFAGRGFSETIHTRSNAEVIERIIEHVGEEIDGLVFANLVDFDMLWGHRNDVPSFRRGLEEFDSALPEITAGLHSEDMLIITADHGTDPTTPSTDHSREYVPLLVYGKRLKGGVDLGTRETFADIGATIAEIFGVRVEAGRSLLKEIRGG